MKFYVICVVVFCAPTVFGMFAASIDDGLHKNEADCASVSGASDSSIEIARKTRQLPDTQQMNAFSKCMLEKYNVMYSDGSINPDVHSYGIITDTGSVFQISERCKTLRGRDADDTARKIMNCYLDGNQIVLGLTPRVRV